MRMPLLSSTALSVGPRQRRKDARPQELLDAALELFVEKGFAATRAEEVAARAGVSKGTLYLYYPSKEDLLKAVIHRHLGQYIVSGAQEVERHQGSAAELMLDVVMPWWQSMAQSPAAGVFKLVITEVRNFPDIAQFYFSEVAGPGQHLIGAILRKGMASGEFRKVEVEATVHSIVLPMIMACLHKHSLGACSVCDTMSADTGQPVLEPQVFIRHHFELVLHSLRARPDISASPSPPKKSPRRGPA
jgi:AcrR family transcriptional regulator